MANASHVAERARTLHEERSQRTRTRLADSAIECLVDSGYRGTNFVEVCRRAGLTRGAAHHHYRDLAALIFDAMRRLNDGLIDRVRPALRDIGDVEKRIDAGIDVLWDVFTSREFKAVVEIWVAQSHDPSLRDRIRSEMDVYSEVVTEGFQKSFPELARDGDDAVLMMRFAFLVVLGLGFLNSTVDPRPLDQDRARMLALLKKVVKREIALMREEP